MNQLIPDRPANPQAEAPPQCCSSTEVPQGTTRRVAQDAYRGPVALLKEAYEETESASVA